MPTPANLDTPEVQAFVTVALGAVQLELRHAAEVMHPFLLVQRTNRVQSQFVIQRESLRSALLAACATSRAGELYALATEAYIWTRPTPAPARMAEMDEAAREKLGIVEGITLTVWAADGGGQMPQRAETRIFQAAIEEGQKLGSVFELDERDVPRPVGASEPV